MKTTKLHLSLFALLTLLSSPVVAAPLGTAFTYQGQLTDGGAPANGVYDLRFTIYDSSSGIGAVAGPITNSPVGVSNGLFTTTLDFGVGAFSGEARWLETAVRTNGGGEFTTLAPRQPLTPTPHALFAATAGSATGASNLLGVLGSEQLAGTYPSAVMLTNPANSLAGDGHGLTQVDAAALGGLRAADLWQLGGNTGTAPGAQFVGTADNQALELRVNRQRALRLEPNPGEAPNVIGGASVNAAASGVLGATIGGGGSSSPGFEATNRVEANYGTIGGGAANTIGSLSRNSTISGGRLNTSSGYEAVVGGGAGNVSSGDNATVAGGRGNTSQGEGATVAGGANNFSGAQYGAVGGGIFNTNAGSHATVGGGRENLASGYGAVVGGGEANQANTNYATVAGGGFNVASGFAATVAGGGGYLDEAEGNSAAGDWSAVGGGKANQAAGEFAVVAGGENNQAEGRYAVVPGGLANRAQGQFSFAAGENTLAEHDGTFVWADASFSGILRSTAPNQFLVRAAGGVGINTDAPQAALHVAGNVRAEGFQGQGTGLTGVDADRLDGRDSTDFAPVTHAHAAEQITSGTLADARLSANIPRLNAVQTFTAANAFNNPGSSFTGTFQGQGGSLSNLNAAHITTGTLADSRLSANIPRLNAAATFTAPVSAPVMQASNLVADSASLNNASLAPGLLLGGTGSGEGVASKRTAGGNQYGLDLFSAFTSRLAIANNGAIHVGAGNAFASYGDARSSMYVLRGTSSGASYGELLQSGSQRVAIPLNSTWTFRIFVAGRASNGKAAGYCLRGFLENESGTVRMLETINSEDIAEDDSGWDVNVTADNYYDALTITARANTGDTARWTAVVYTCEVKW